MTNNRDKNAALFRRPEQEARLVQHLKQQLDSEEESQHLLLVTGSLGVGKTTLIRQAQIQMQRESNNENTVWLQGSWMLPSTTTTTTTTSNNSNTDVAVPYAAFCEALNTFFSDQILVQEEKQKWQERLFQASLGEVRLLTTAIPALATLFHEQPPPPRRRSVTDPTVLFSLAHHTTTDDQELLERLQLLLSRIFAALTTPFVMILDNLEYADTYSLQLLSRLLTHSSLCGMAIVCTCDDGIMNGGDDDAVMATLRALEGDLSVTVSELALENLSRTETFDFVTRTLQLEKNDGSNKLCQQIFDHSRGNLMEISQMIRSMQTQHTAVTLQENLTELSEGFQIWLQVAACLGYEFVAQEVDYGTSSKYSSAPSSSSSLDNDDDNNNGSRQYLQQALELGWVVKTAVDDDDALQCAFVHRRVWEMCYALVPPDERSRWHVDIGKRMWRKLTKLDQVEPYCIAIARQLEYGLGEITNEEERLEVCKLFFLAAQKAEQEYSMGLATSLLETSCSLLPVRHWRDHYSLTLNIYNALAEAEFSVGNMEKSAQYVAEIMESARSLDDKLVAYAVNIYILGSQLRLKDAIQMGLKVLQELKETIPRRVGPVRLVAKLYKVHRMLRKKDVEDILDLPTMVDSHYLAVVRILSTVYIYTFTVNPNLASFIALRVVELTLEHGMSAMSASGFIFYGMLQCLVLGRIEESYRWGCLAHQTLERFKTEQWLPRIMLGSGIINVSLFPMPECVPPLYRSYRLAMATGDTECAMFALELGSAVEFFGTRVTLPECYERMVQQREVMERARLEVNLVSHALLLQVVANLIDSSNKTSWSVFSGDYLDEDYVLRKGKEEGHTVLLFVLYLLKGLMAFWMNDYEDAEENFKRSARISSMASNFSRCAIAMARGTSNILLAQRYPWQRYWRMSIARRCLRFLRKHAESAPENQMNKVSFLKGQFALARGNLDEGLAHLACAERLSKSGGGTLYDEALSIEYAGLALCNKGKLREGVKQLERARAVYDRWGASVKVEQLDTVITSHSLTLSASLEFKDTWEFRHLVQHLPK